MDLPGPVLLFDGSCPLCQRVVRLLIRLDDHGRLRFAALQGLAGQAFLRGQGLPLDDFDSLIFVPDWPRRGQRGFLLRTDGMLAALRVCGEWGAELAAVLAVWPRPWRDAGYRFVARSRHRIFRPSPASNLARPEWADRFLP